jgi:tetratricopeptide (TPR) repeat protein
LTSPGEPNLLYEQAYALKVRMYSDTELETAIIQWGLFLEWLPASSLDLKALSEMAELLRIRYKSHGSMDDLQRSVELHREVLRHLTVRNHRSPVALNNLGVALAERWYNLTADEDILEAISLHEEAVSLCASPDDKIGRAISLGNLADALLHKNLRDKELSQVQKAVSLLREAISLVPEDRVLWAHLSRKLGKALDRHHSHIGGSIDELHSIISLCKAAYSRLVPHHRDWPEALVGIATSVGRLSAILSSTPMREETRLLLRTVLDRTSPTHPRRYLASTRLGHMASNTYDVGEGSKLDLEAGVVLTREATNLITPRHIHYRICRSHEALTLTTRFRARLDRADVDKAVLILSEIVDRVPATDPARFVDIQALASALEDRFKRYGVQEDIHVAITLSYEAVQLCPLGHSYHAGNVGRLANRVILGSAACSVAEINKVISLYEPILSRELLAHLGEKSEHLRCLAQLHYARYQKDGDHRDWATSMGFFERAVGETGSSDLCRFEAAKTWLKTAESSSSLDIAMKAYQHAVAILPYREYLGLDLTSQLDSVKREAASLSCDAAGCALALLDPFEAVTMLERGRAIFWSRRLQLRMPLDGLPEPFAHQLLTAAERIESYHGQRYSADAEGEGRRREQRIEHEAFRALVQTARVFPAFRDIFLPPSYEQLREAAKEGPVISLLSSQRYGSFAIVIMDSQSSAKHISLPSVTVKSLQDMATSMDHSINFGRSTMREGTEYNTSRLSLIRKRVAANENSEVLGVLWTHVVAPIVKHLRLKVNHRHKV